MVTEEELDRMAEWIVTHPPDINPEFVGGKLADAKAVINPLLRGEERAAALREKGEAIRWIGVEATKRNYPILTRGVSLPATASDVIAWIEDNWKIVTEEGPPYFRVDYSKWQRYKQSIGERPY